MYQCIDKRPEVLNEIYKEFIATVKEIAGPKCKVGSTERFQFYKDAKEAYAII